MKVRCVDTKIAVDVAKRNRRKPMIEDDLTIGDEYRVWSVYVVPESDLYRWHISYVIEIDPYLLAPIPSQFFELVDQSVGCDWEMRFAETGVVVFGPVSLSEPNLVERALDGDRAAREIIDAVRNSFNTSQ